MISGMIGLMSYSIYPSGRTSRPLCELLSEPSVTVYCYTQTTIPSHFSSAFSIWGRISNV